MARLQLTGLTKTYGDVRAVADVDLDIAQGELVVLLGPSGCGKTTTLRMIAGFVAPTAGEIRLGGRDITRQPPWRRNTGLVFQSYALFPHLTAAENIAFGLRMRNLPPPQVGAKVGKFGIGCVVDEANAGHGCLWIGTRLSVIATQKVAPGLAAPTSVKQHRD